MNDDCFNDDCCGAAARSKPGAEIKLGAYALPKKRLINFGIALSLWGAGLLLTRFNPLNSLALPAGIVPFGRFLPLAPFLAAWLCRRVLPPSAAFCPWSLFLPPGFWRASRC
jgi:hypothetical protein